MTVTNDSSDGACRTLLFEEPRLDARDIARLVTVPQMLRHLGWRTGSRARADCGLCRGHSTSTVAYREHVWTCHRCHAGGDVYSLVRAVQRCDFPAALAYVAEIAGVRLAAPRSADARREIANQRQRQRIDTAADLLEQAERELLRECRKRIHDCDRVLSVPGPWDEAQWRQAQWACILLRYLLAEYTLLAFGGLAERARYVLHPEGRAVMVAAILDAGGVRNDDGRWQDVLA